jgi:hypothetical protein
MRTQLKIPTVSPEGPAIIQIDHIIKRTRIAAVQGVRNGAANLTAAIATTNHQQMKPLLKFDSRNQEPRVV